MAKPRKVRRVVPFKQRPITPGSSITFGDALRQANNAAKVQYGPKLAALRTNIAQTQQLGKDQQGWYQQYLAQLAQYQRDTENQARATNTAMQQQADSLRTLDQGNLTAQQQQMNADAAARGATASPQTSVDASNASLVRQALEGSLGALIAQRGQSASDYASNLAHVVAPIQQGQALAQNARQLLDAQGQLANERGIVGAFRQSVIDAIRAGEAKNVLASAIAQGKDVASLARITETTRHNKAQEKIAANNPSKAKTKAELAYFQKHGYWPPTGPPHKPGAKRPTAGPGSLTTGQENTLAKPINNALSWVSRLKSQGKSQSQIRQLLLQGVSAKGSNGATLRIPAFDTYAVNAAMDIGFRGGLSPANVKALHAMGIHVNGRWPVLRAVKGTTVQQTAAMNNIFGLPPTTGG